MTDGTLSSWKPPTGTTFPSTLDIYYQPALVITIPTENMCCGNFDQKFSDPPEKIPDPQSQLQELESQIVQLKALLDDLEHRCVPMLKREINRRFPPILRLPPELSSQIFTAAFPENSWNAWQSTTPLLFGKVCSTWRRIAWSTPRLWNTISLRHQKYTSVHIELFEEWLERSGRCPLSIQISYPSLHKSLSPPSTTFWQIIHLISSSSGRWRNLDLDFSDPALFERFCLTLSNRHVPLLTSLSVKLGTTDDPHHYIQLFRHAPQLRYVRLRGAASLRTLILPISQLARVWLAYTTIDEFLILLRDNPQLSNCIFDCIERGSTHDLPHVSVDRLEALDIYLGDRRAAWELFDYLTIPSMRELTINTYILPLRASSFISFVQRSGCMLQRLSLSSTTMSVKHFDDCMRAIPSLVELDLQYMIVTGREGTDGISSVLNVNLSGCLLPNLRKLRYTTQFICLPGWLDVISSRWRLHDEASPRPTFKTTSLQTSRLQSIILSSNTRDIPDAVILEGFSKFAAEGMEISLTTHDRKWL